MSEHEQSGKPKRNPGNAFQSIGDEGGLVVVPKNSTVEVLNPVGSRIFEMLDGTHSRDQIVQALVEEFEVTEDEASHDLDVFLADLKKRQLLAPGGEHE